MITFMCSKLVRDRTLERFSNDKIIPKYRMLRGKELGVALKLKLIEEAHEVKIARDRRELIAEIADVLEVIDGLCREYKISADDIALIKKTTRKKRGGFEKGIFVETIEVADNSPRVKYFRRSPDKYPEI